MQKLSKELCDEYYRTNINPFTGRCVNKKMKEKLDGLCGERHLSSETYKIPEIYQPEIYQTPKYKSISAIYTPSPMTTPYKYKTPSLETPLTPSPRITTPSRTPSLKTPSPLMPSPRITTPSLETPLTPSLLKRSPQIPTPSKSRTPYLKIPTSTPRTPSSLKRSPQIYTPYRSKTPSLIPESIEIPSSNKEYDCIQYLREKNYTITKRQISPRTKTTTTLVTKLPQQQEVNRLSIRRASPKFKRIETDPFLREIRKGKQNLKHISLQAKRNKTDSFLREIRKRKQNLKHISPQAKKIETESFLREIRKAKQNLRHFEM